MLAAVHYGELSRSPAQHVVQELVASEVAQEFIEVTHQPDLVTTPNIPELLTWRHDQVLLEHQWRDHLDTANVLQNFASNVNERLYRRRLRRDRTFRGSQWRARQIEKFVTAKHIQAWRQFIDSSCSVLVVIESDATLTPDSVRGVADAVAELSGGRPTYVNLAGGLNAQDISIEHLAASQANGMTEFTRPVTNTSCAYAVNRAVILELLSFLSTNPKAGTLGIDWLINSFFIHQTSAGNNICCLHFQPPALLHGSLTGITQSWHPDR